MKRARHALAAALAVCAITSTAAADNGNEAIRIGQTLPYSGPVSGFGTIGRAQEAFFAKVNAEGGINGRQVKFITLDDAYSPPKTVEQTRKLVEQEEVLMMFGSLGTATNNAVHRYLNTKKIPQLFVLSGATKWADPKTYPWTMPGMASYESEGVVYAKYVLQAKPDAKIAILAQNDDFGRDYVAGFKRALGSKAASMIVAEASYETSAPTISSQLATLKASGADVLFGVVLGKFTPQMIKGVAEIGWKPDLFFVPTSASSISFLESAGLENAVGLISSSNQKDTMDAQWADDPAVKDYLAFMKQYLPNADLSNSNYSAGYHYATLLMAVLKACKNDFSRENIMRQAASLRDVPLPLLLPGMTVSTGPDDYLPFQQLRLRRFNGKSWISFGEILDDR
ncbi:branched-chain amino acid transport system substrate-binding protein [Bradyrhizobium japonicum]|jgi:branched-chain amino acid transport system substrate-binding protein|uniref:Branched-chain amino acid transport system substrate-binding protein n=1 Tax=Bradyrhizobium elkanii TaxID=29448 RepID=A0ABV4FBQ4_BRAEL|nr:ABC transporter substrate-binding protein [Bradyrhizobium elkanii]MBP2431996.1 branched-chain amino acid transport system substrate-binding protein [Bradyrhizobium elkanii]MCP1734929.1 branched-chain amino acid transport system substrate-binding protein [Bradyrhizobium elkanii]MCP1752475.1 branched-chain amino acid transport system substrate-binding protein [Bradyrhizobium elkanii]MCP1978248.1 branched-chain amino acid transport system substrate-binding protein [Bradyrhizobium elkanii]MCS35